MIAPRISNTINRWRYQLMQQRIRDIQIPGGAVSVTFDDFPVSAATKAADALEAQQMQGTFYLAPGLISKHDKEVGQIASFEDVADLVARGHEIGARPYSNQICENLSSAKLGAEYSKSSEFLDTINGNRHFAFPDGAYDDTSLLYFSKRYETLRTTAIGLNAGESDLNRLRANAISGDINFSKIEKQLDDARKRNGWLIFYTHDVSDNPSNRGIATSDFVRLLALIRDSGVRVGTMSSITRHLTA
ncbi:MAG: polysaccharide deacetylase family protein [Pseudomonadota bacterium]